MANKFIHCDIKKGVEYASVYTPRKVNGKKVNDPEYLGRVVDKDNGVYYSRKRGTFAYTIENGYSDLPSGSYAQAVPSAFNEEKLILDFGDAYCLYSTLRRNGLHDVLDALTPGAEDTLMSLIGYKLLASGSNRYAEDWWEGSYASVLFPNAKLRSQRISEFYAKIGEEEAQRRFFSKYLPLTCKNNQAGVLIDSSGLPNDICFPLTAVNTHNGVTSNEARLLLVVDRKTGTPLFFRYNAGNIVDVTTLRSTIYELEAYGINTDYAILDAGYYSETNVKDLYGNGDDEKAIPFLTRLIPNRILYKQLIAQHAADLNESKYLLMQRDRLLSVKRVEVDLFGHTGYAYIAVDHARREDEIFKYAKNALESKDVSYAEMDEAIKTKGLFILISSEDIDAKDVMPLYYTRQAIEQVFDVSKNNADLLPLRVHNEETFRGHLMLSFIASVVYLAVNQLLKDTVYCTQSAFMILRDYSKSPTKTNRGTRNICSTTHLRRRKRTLSLLQRFMQKKEMAITVSELSL